MTTPDDTDMPSQRVRPAERSNITEPAPTVLLMGLSGVGKSSFISHFSNDMVGVGDSIHSCTSKIHVHAGDFKGRRILFIDTPGFDDAGQSNLDLLAPLISELCEMRRQRVPIAGVIYMHRITDVRVAGSARQSLEIVRHLCGQEAFGSITFVTTMWEDLLSNADGEEREQSLQEDVRFWHDMCTHGSMVLRMERYTAQAAKDVLKAVLERSPHAVLQVQRELVDEKRPFGETAIAKYMIAELEKMEQSHSRDLHDLETELEQARQDGDSDVVPELEQLLDSSRLRSVSVQTVIDNLSLPKPEVFGSSHAQHASTTRPDANQPGRGGDGSREPTHHGILASSSKSHVQTTSEILSQRLQDLEATKQKLTLQLARERQITSRSNEEAREDRRRSIEREEELPAPRDTKKPGSRFFLSGGKKGRAPGWGSSRGD